ncbi:hypothetical protein M758_10G088900 [Ceratodon purpureus]|uniref:Beta-hexosaminidase n=1 Tax=Ceratodon purpureus TaxID=3225 RepID=A0A8T0GL18_CERPU|nr:hypothetical protein KC19_10G090400 [Ceratodon purpureus]KAG0603376.1 hypothetical protein M758_10G088900 [Ceratodon purpureus]
MERGGVVLVVLCVIFVCVWGVEGNGAPRPKLWSILDEDGEWHVQAGTYGMERRGVGKEEDGGDVKIWPMPYSVAHGDGTVMLDRGSFQFEFDAGNGSAMPDTLAKAFVRYYDLIFSQHAPRWDASPSDHALVKLVVGLGSRNEELQYGVDESYTLEVPDSSASNVAYLEAHTVYGALRGLETFSQLTTFNFKSKKVQISNTPYVIKDFPRFAYRGLLIDTSRHYQPVSSIKRVLDSMAYSKLNVLHWHIVDEQSFPIEIPSYPLLWKGAYSYAERYTMDDARDIVEYARLRGINVMPELDVPGHAASWGVGYPDLWPASECIEPLDVSKNFTFDVINGIIGDFRAVFPFKFAHLGGDEVDTSCWEQTSHVKSWLNDRNISTKDAYANFVVRAQDIAIKHGYVPVNWEETFYTFASQLREETVVHNWLRGGTCRKAVKKGFRCIMSDQATWYLDHLDAPWDKFYDTEPLLNITDPDEQSLVIGGEVCMWGETVDESNILQTIWPRAAAAAERLWSSLDFTKQGATTALKRFQYFRCLLNRRGISAAPVFYGSSYALGRDSPRDPGSCFKQ